MPFVIVAYERVNGDSPFFTFQATLGLKHQAQIDAWIVTLHERGIPGTAAKEWTKHVGNVWELRRPPYFRVYFFWEPKNQVYILLNGHRKQRERPWKNLKTVL